jgi:drug/metabolite transporter (DMT)-like permease
VSDPRVLVPLLLVVESLHYVFARLLLGVLPPATSGFYMMAIATVQVAVLMRGRIQFRVLARHRVFFAVIGLLIAVNTNMGFVAVRYVDPGTAALLTRTSVLFGVGLGVLWLGERLNRVEVGGTLVSLAGLAIVCFQPGDYFRFGSLMVVGATFLYALHAAVVKRHGGGIPFAEFFLFRIGATTAFLGGLSAGQGALVWPGAAAWPILVLSATVDVVLSRAIYYLALRRLDMSLLTIISTASPVVTMLWSLLLFGSVPTLREAVGGIPILLGVAIVTASRGGLLRDWRRPRRRTQPAGEAGDRTRA